MISSAISRILKIIKYRSYVPTDFYIYEDKKLVYLSIPKVACTSIKIATVPDYNKADKDSYMDIHSEAEHLHASSLSNIQEKYYKFAFVRSPFDRLISCYEDKVKKTVQHNGRYFFDTTYNKIIMRLFGNKFDADMSFSDFVQLVSKIPDWLSDGHFRSQYSMLYKNGKLNVDYIGKFEALENDWLPIAKKFDFPALPMKNTTNRREYLGYYETVETLDLVKQRYMSDVDSFNYEQHYQAIKDQIKDR